MTIGDSSIGRYYSNEFGFSEHKNSYGTGYLINWAKHALNNSHVSLVELPVVYSHADVLKGNFAEKYINASLRMLSEF